MDATPTCAISPIIAPTAQRCRTTYIYILGRSSPSSIFRTPRAGRSQTHAARGADSVEWWWKLRDLMPTWKWGLRQVPKYLLLTQSPSCTACTPLRCGRLVWRR